MTDIADASVVFELRNLTVALAVGFLIGFEREHAHAAEAKAHTFAGARTFTLTALAGGLCGLVDPGILLTAALLIAIALLTALAYWAVARAEPGAGGTTEIALLVAYLLGVAATSGHVLIAAVAGVATAIILSVKKSVEKWAAAFTRQEFAAVLRFLAISVIILPVLPDTPFGSYGVLNAREFWLMVVFISGLSFLGYWLIKLLGAGRGMLLTGLAGGLASSTATTLSLARLSRSGGNASEIAAGIIAANLMMLLRIGILTAALSRPTLAALWPSLLVAAFVGAASLWLLRARQPNGLREKALVVENPMEIRPALVFAVLLAVISLAASFGADRFGQSGLLAVAALSGLADVDAITLVSGRQAGAGAVLPVLAATAILTAAAANILLKGAMAWVVGGRGAGLRVMAVFVLVLLAGLGAALTTF